MANPFDQFDEAPAAKTRGGDPFEAALAAEGVTGKVADIARSIYQQESGSGKNAKTSNAGAVGGMQVIPSTFSSVADKGWDIADPVANARAGIRYVKQGFEASGGDPALTGAFYYGGPGGLEKARRGVAVSDPRNPGAPTTLQYGQQVAARVPKEKGLIQRGVEAVIPSAEAAQPGMLEAGNIDLNRRPVVKNTDGSISTVRSIGVNVGGQEVLIPTVSPDGRILSEREAVDLYKRTGQHLGKFATPAASTAYAESLHNDQDKLYSPRAARAPAQAASAGPNPFDQFDVPADVPRVEVRGTAADEPRGFVNSAIDATKNIGVGALRGAAGIGSTLLAPTDYLADKISGRPGGTANRERRASIDQFASENADTSSINYNAGKIGTEIAGTLGTGNVLAAPVRAVAPRLANALASGGMQIGPGGNALMNAATRVAGGAVTGAASAGLVDPETAGTGAIIGGAIPGATQIAGAVGRGAGWAIAGKAMAPEVQALAQRAKALGIDIPADRLVNSKPLNALASSLDYVPLSGRTATMNKMEDQLNTAVSRTFGQDSSNVTQALRKAGDELGAKFDAVLQNNTVKVDNAFLTELAEASSMANKELGSDGARIINNQVDEILAKASQTGEIDGQAAYNIKKTLDRIGKRNSPEAHYALDLKQRLMDALNRSLGPTEAAAFKTTRQQYGNMLSMEKLASNGAEGGVSIARLGNLKNINNPELQELADISAQFLKSREGAHGAAQRVGAGALALGLTGPSGLAAGMATGRGANMLLNSAAARNALMRQPPNPVMRLVGEPDVTELLTRAAPPALAGPFSGR